MLYRVLQLVYNPRTETISWICMGLVKDMAEAKKLYGGYPVLERAK